MNAKYLINLFQPVLKQQAWGNQSELNSVKKRLKSKKYVLLQKNAGVTMDQLLNFNVDQKKENVIR